LKILQFLYKNHKKKNNLLKESENGVHLGVLKREYFENSLGAFFRDLSVGF
jgi:hypothetical protein